MLLNSWADPIKIQAFQASLLLWYTSNARAFPWRYIFDPYKVLVSEFLLQQTDAAKVIKVYKDILEDYPTISDLSNADPNQLKIYFLKLGLFFRSERLIKAANQIKEQYAGIIPIEKTELKKLHGVGDYISSAVLCFGYNKAQAIVDTNIIRIFERCFGIKSSSSRPRTDKAIWAFAEEILPVQNYADYNYALLDFAALVCTARKPKCAECFFGQNCEMMLKEVKEISHIS